MRTLIVSGGRIGRGFALSFLETERFDRIIGVDNGLRFLYENGIMPTHVVGDFDTAAPELVDYYRSRDEIEIRTFNPVKDSTDIGPGTSEYGDCHSGRNGKPHRSCAGEHSEPDAG